jgi:hypothetical protein
MLTPDYEQVLSCVAELKTAKDTNDQQLKQANGNSPELEKTGLDIILALHSMSTSGAQDEALRSVFGEQYESIITKAYVKSTDSMFSRIQAEVYTTSSVTRTGAEGNADTGNDLSTMNTSMTNPTATIGKQLRHAHVSPNTQTGVSRRSQ